ncbi:hypothetical protein [Chloroherpeton thalassium]|uniref:hypothetical protein n=1 Tax=Chloroherpeton thalassium TaxID=100716 RepID=UPI00145E513C|nr:hypothetical protein [Chloroherpeton thalassium]
MDEEAQHDNLPQKLPLEQIIIPFGQIRLQHFRQIHPFEFCHNANGLTYENQDFKSAFLARRHEFMLRAKREHSWPRV